MNINNYYHKYNKIFFYKSQASRPILACDSAKVVGKSTISIRFFPIHYEFFPFTEFFRNDCCNRLKESSLVAYIVHIPNFNRKQDLNCNVNLLQFTT